MFQLKKPPVFRPRQKEITIFPDGKAPKGTEERGLGASARFFLDHVIGVAVSSVAGRQAKSARLAFKGQNGTIFHVLISLDQAGDFIAYSNDLSLTFGDAPSLYVVDHTPREVEHSIFLYASERLAGEPFVTAQVYRESASMFEFAMLEGSSVDGPRSLKACSSRRTH